MALLEAHPGHELSLSMMQSAEAKLLGLEDPVYPHLAVPVRNPTSPNTAITFRQLFAATSSIADNPVVLSPLVTKGDSPISTEQFLEGYFGAAGLYWSPDNWKMAAPGTSSGSSAVAVTLASYAIERRRQIDFAAEAKEHIFTPLGMTSTGYRLSEIDTARLASGHLIANDGSFAQQPAIADRQPPLVQAVLERQVLAGEGGGLLGRPVGDHSHADTVRP